MHIKIIISCCLFYCASLHANWEQHLRPCVGKTNIHSMPEIDFIYMINLKERPQKWQACFNQLSQYGIIPYRFDAINGWEMPPESFKKLGCPDLIEDMTPGKAACVLSHLSVLQDAYQSGYNTIWLMEDDIQVIENPQQLPGLIRSLDQVAPHWDILYTDFETKDFYGSRVPCMAIRPRPNLVPKPLDFYLRRIPINETFLEVGMRYGCYSMIIRRSGIKKILDYFTKYRLYLPIDMELFFVPNLKQIVLYRDIVSTLPGIQSDTTYPLQPN